MPHHVVQRGNNRRAAFYHIDDRSRYLEILGEATATHDVAIHAYVLMTNHVHLLMTPGTENGLSLTMQALGRKYVAYINKTYQRTGTLWEGRFKCSLIDTDRYCMACYRYIDLNPVRAGMVGNLDEYRWSSYRHNALGVENELLVPHDSYLQLGETDRSRADRYRELVSAALSEDTLRCIRYGIMKGLPVGSNRFKADIENHLGQRLGTGKVGRPAKR